MIVPYLLQESTFDFEAVRRFGQYSFVGYGIKETDLNQMLIDLNSLLAPYNIIQNESDEKRAILGGSLTLVFFIISVVVGFTVNYIAVLAVVLVYFFVLCGSISACTPSISKMLRAKHFLLAYGLRAWNNRIFLKHGIELRPGYLARWIEVRVI